MNDQELQIKFQMFEQQIMQLQQQLQAVDQAIVELKQLNIALDELKGNEGKEMLSPIGRGVFVKTKLVSDELIVDIGDKNYVDKSVPDTKKIIEEQIEKLGSSKEVLEGELEKLNQEITKAFLEHQKKNAESQDHDCKCDEENHSCGCEHKH